MNNLVHIVIAMKPFEESFVENAIKHGVSGLNIDGCRIAGGWTRKATSGVTPYGSEKTWHGRVQGEYSTTKDKDRGSQGRWPANIILGHAEGCKCVGTKQVKPSNGSGMASGKGSKSLFDGGADRQENGFINSDGKEEIEAWECVEGCPVRVLGEQSGELSVCGGIKKTDGSGGLYEMGSAGAPGRIYSDKGTASRFFKQVKEFQE
jgi:hypothetical protein